MPVLLVRKFLSLAQESQAVQHPAAFTQCVERILRAEQGDGWLVTCADNDQYLVANCELIRALADLLRGFGQPPVLEVCAGCGTLAAGLNAAGLDVIATDIDARASSVVLDASATTALERFQPRVVLGVFIPVDADIDRAILRSKSVTDYVVLGARLGGQFGSAALWQQEAWTAESLPDISRWMLTRHDVWIPGRNPPLLQHGEAWWFRRGNRG